MSARHLGASGGTPLISFRGGELLPDLESRNPNAPGQAAKRDLERYYSLLRHALEQLAFDLADAALVVDALHGQIPAGFDRWSDWLHYTVTAAVVEGDEDLPGKWHADWLELSEKLARLDEASAIAVIDAAERFWRGQRPEETTESGLGRVGLIRSGAG